MRKMVVFVCFVFFSATTTNVLAAEKLKSGQVTHGMAGPTVRQPGTRPPVKPVGTLPPKAVPLSVLDCAKLGGGLVRASVCNSKTACHTKDQNGQSHYVCVTSIISD